MGGMNALLALAAVVIAKDPVPADNDVVAGWTAFALFIGLGLAVAFLGWSLTKQLRKANAAAEAGLYDPSDPRPEAYPGFNTGTRPNSTPER